VSGDGIGGPFAVGDVAVGGNLEAELGVAVCKGCEAALGFVDRVDPGREGAIAATECL